MAGFCTKMGGFPSPALIGGVSILARLGLSCAYRSMLNFDNRTLVDFPGVKNVPNDTQKDCRSKYETSVIHRSRSYR